MSKRLVVCCDGTWNTADQDDRGRPAPTNVTRLSNAVSLTDGDGMEQLTFYHPGVGTRRGEKLRGGAFGFGLSRDVRDAYRFIVENFEPGDELFFFGFSRGAFTARSAVGFVRNCGVLRRENAGRIDEAYQLYRSRGTPPASAEAAKFRSEYSVETRIRFIGVWDTVGALGIPLDGLRFLNFLNRGVQFHDLALSSTVDAAYQALAIDEKRRPFRPAVWTPPHEGRTEVQQVWFAGVHCNVGGGYVDHSLSDITLNWMVNNAARHGLAVDPTTLAEGGTNDKGLPLGALTPNPMGVLRESRTSFYTLIPPYSRPIDRDAASCEWASSSAKTRFDAHSGYDPKNLNTYLGGDPHQTADV